MANKNVSTTVAIGVAVAASIVGGVAATRSAARGPGVEIIAKKNVPKDAKHLWEKQPDGGTLLRDPLPTLDDGGCQAWATRCTDGKCKGSCE